ncbi:MAG: carboxylesterase family protein [Rhodospirillaceae bacterium]|nr:carboxylesterase family protein [Rhodospirillaceae bacterium]
MTLARRALLKAGLIALPFMARAEKMSEPRSPVVETQEGPVRGVMDGDVAIFRGIPFARAPVGALRFKSPEPPPKWRGVRDSSQFGPGVPQNASRLSRIMGDFILPQSEDNCLTLNIWSPSLKGPPAPVMIWLHGGGYTSGAGSLRWYTGQSFARNGRIVVVTVNYRLGPLGFLYLPGIAPGNMGILDQRMALAWVRQNIARFGGDPANITLAGQSAGGRCVALHMASPETGPSLRRAILQSPSFGLPPTPADEAAKRARSYVEILKLDRLADITRVPAEKLLTAFGEYNRRNRRFASSESAFGIVNDGAIITDDAIESLIRGSADGIDLLFGTTRDESAAHFLIDNDVLTATDAQVHERFRSVFGDTYAPYLDEFRRLYPAATPFTLLVHLITEQNFMRKGLELAEARANRGKPGFVYRFDWQSPAPNFGALHTIELPFVFNNLSDWPNSPMLAGGNERQMAALAATIHKAWINFIATGNPNHDQMPVWAPYESGKRITMKFDTAVEPVGDLAGIHWRKPWPTTPS